MTELRKRMIEDMELAGLVLGTQEAYIRAVRQLASHFRFSPDRLSERQLRAYLIHVRDVRTVAKGRGAQGLIRVNAAMISLNRGRCLRQEVGPSRNGSRPDTRTRWMHGPAQSKRGCTLLSMPRAGDMESRRLA